MTQTVDKTSFDQLGYSVARGFLALSELEELATAIANYIRDVVPTLSESEAFYQDRSKPETLKQLQDMGRTEFFRNYMKHPKWVNLAETLLGEKANAAQPEWFNKPPGTIHVTPPHQDNYYFCLTPPQVVTIWCALDHVDDENGVLCYVKGSHKHGFRPHGRSSIVGFSQGITDYGPADEANEARISLAPGDALVHHGMTIHRADPNRSSTRHRRAFAMVFRGESCRRDEEAYQRYERSLRAQRQEMANA